MFKDVGKRALLFALILGLLTAGGIYFYLASLSKEAEVKTAPVVVVVRNIPGRTILRSESLEVQQIPRELVHARALTSLEEARGRIALVPLVAGEQLLADRVAGGEGATGDLAYRIKPGQRAITIAANEISGVAGLVQPGNYIDVLVTLEKDDYGRDATKTILQNRLVLAVDSQMSQRSAEQSTTVKHYTLEVSPGEAEVLTFAEEKGKLKVVLRSQGDQKSAETGGAGFANL
jgi:pilus assembly protein CpaB